jgi:hypothetical protein
MKYRVHGIASFLNNIDAHEVANYLVPIVCVRIGSTAQSKDKRIRIGMSVCSPDSEWQWYQLTKKEE